MLTGEIKIMVFFRLPALQSLLYDLVCTPAGGAALLHRLVGRNLRFNRADPPLHYGQPSPLRCVLLSPQGLATLRGPQIPKAAWGKPQDPERTGTPARNGCAVPKRGLNGAYRVSATHFYRLPRWCAEWRTTTPVPSSEEGNDGGSEQIPSGLLPQVFTAIMACR